MKKLVISLLIGIVSQCATAEAFNHYFSQAEIVDSMEMTFGYFDHSLGFALPFRVDVPWSRELQWYGQGEIIQEDVSDENLSTFALGAGGMYQFFTQTSDVPFSFSVKGGYLHIFEKTKYVDDTRIRILGGDAINFSGIASSDLGVYIDFPLITYALLDLRLDLTDSDTLMTLAIGARAHLNDNWSALIEIDFGKGDGFGIGATYRF